VFPEARNCGSTADNDCDGRADNTVDNACTCAIGTTQACGAHPGLDGNGQCQAGFQTCEARTNGTTSTFGGCTGSVGPAAADTCVEGNDANCNGRENDGCACINGDTRPCGSTDVGVCAFGSQTCVNGVFSQQCAGAANPGQRNCGSAEDNDCDGEPDNTLDNVCECSPGQGNGPCSGDAGNSRCNDQGQCVPCQSDADCSLVGGGRTTCGSGLCVALESIAVWDILLGNGESLPVTSTIDGVEGTAITRSPPVQGQVALEIFANLDWPTDDDSIDLTEFFEFGVTASSGTSITYEEIELAISCQSCTPAGASANWQIRSSVDNYLSVVAEGSAPSMLPNPAVLTPSIRSIGTRAGSVQFRFYVFNVRSTSGEGNPIVGLKGTSGVGQPGLSLSLTGGVSDL